MIVAGIMSGTSADGIDIAIVDIGKAEHDTGVKLSLLHHSSHAYDPELRSAVLEAMDAQQISAARLGRINWRLGLAYADAVKEAIAASGKVVELIGCHGQTIYHQGEPDKFAGRRFACTWQLGEMALIAEAVRCPVVSNFRPADMAAGGQGAPLVPYLDYALFRHATRNRVLQNLGGIANLTAIPAGASADNILAFDTGPANMVIDALMQQYFHQPFDRKGETAARGSVHQSIIEKYLSAPYFKQAPPKSTGREQYGQSFAHTFGSDCLARGLSTEDTIATATAFTATTIASAIRDFVVPVLGPSPTDYLVAGGGARNNTLMRMLEEQLQPLGWTVGSLDSHGLPAQAKEAAAFALMAYETWHHQPSNVPAATGASRPCILGQVIYSA